LKYCSALQYFESSENTKHHGVTSQNTGIFSSTPMKTWDL